MFLMWNLWVCSTLSSLRTWIGYIQFPSSAQVKTDASVSLKNGHANGVSNGVHSGAAAKTNAVPNGALAKENNGALKVPCNGTTTSATAYEGMTVRNRGEI